METTDIKPYDDPFAGNILVERMRPMLPRPQTLELLNYRPPMPGNVSSIPRHVRIHHLQMLRELHIVSREEAKLSDSLDLMIRDSYRYRDPRRATTWAALRGEGYGSRLAPSAMAALVTGFSGTGKTSAIKNVLSTYEQVIVHDDFPGASQPLQQVTWLSLDVPASGRSMDLATALMYEWDRVCGTNRFARPLSRFRPRGPSLLQEFKQAASAQFLGLLHLDEVQNLFRLPSLRNRKIRGPDDFELSIVEDECLKYFLNMHNTGQIALTYSGTPDGMRALTKRLATTQRFITGGYHRFHHFRDTSDREYSENLLPQLMRYQFVAKPLQLNEEFATLVLELSGGIYRVIIALWVAAHRIAFERIDSDELRIADFKKAADTYLSPLKPAIEALKSQDPMQMARFEDLVQHGDDFWSTFWQQ